MKTKLTEKVYFCFNPQGIRAVEHLININNLHLYLEIFKLALEAGYTDIAEMYEQDGPDDFSLTTMPIESYIEELRERFKVKLEKRLLKLFSSIK